MPPSDSPVGSPDARSFLQLALESRGGARIVFEKQETATSFLQRCHAVRTNDRKLSKKVHQHGDPMWGASIFDAITIKKEPHPPLHCARCRAELGNCWAVVAIKEIELVKELYHVETF